MTTHKADMWLEGKTKEFANFHTLQWERALGDMPGFCHKLSLQGFESPTEASVKWFKIVDGGHQTIPVSYLTHTY